MIYRNNSLPRKGMILLVVVAFLALFSVMGVTYIIYADSQLRQTADDVNAQDVRQNPVKMVDIDPSFILNFFLERFLYDQSDVTLNAFGSVTNNFPDSIYSALRGHSLARNIYGGYEPGTGAIAGLAPITGGVLTTIPVVYGGSGYQLPPAVTITGGGATTNATAVADIANGVVSGIRIINGGAGYITPPTVTLTAPLNDRTFSGTGKLNRQITVEGQNVEEWKIVNHTAFNPATLPIIDPERGLRTAANTARSNFTSAWNAPYTYPDQNNFYLGWLKSDGSRVIPSFQRDYIFGHGQQQSDIFTLPVAGVPINSPPSGNLNWINPIGKYLFARPRPFDHLLTADLNIINSQPNQNSSMNTAINIINQRIFESKLFPYPEADGMDVKNLEGYPGGNDSIWIDVGSPVFKTADGRKYKIMIAPLILDLDGKINLNVAGNVMGPGSSHGSNQGWGPWEVNPAKIVQPLEIQTMINSLNNPMTGKIQLPGRYTNLLQLPAGFDGSMVNYPSGAQGLMINSPFSPSYAMVDYNGSLDFGAVGNEGYFKTPAFNDLMSVTSFQSFPSFPPKNFGGAGNAETKTVGGDYNHASLYNPLRPTFSSKLAANNSVVGPNRGFTPRETASLLNWGSKSGTLSSSALMQFFPNSMEPKNPNTTNSQTIKNRSFITTLSSDLARIATPPYIANSQGSPYQMNGNYPRANDIAYAPSLTQLPVGSTSDLDKISFYDNVNKVIVTQTSGLRSINPQNMKVDLTRKLTDYPKPDTNFTNVNGGSGGRYPNLANPAIFNANSDRQKFALDIFNALLKATGAKDMSLSTIPLQGIGATDPDYEANRYLAQLAVNIVDYIDNDDVMTEFVWKKDPAVTPDPTKHERVYGVELNKVVLNEVYAEIINDPTDTFPEKPPTSMMFPASKDKPFQVHFWVELMNPLPVPSVAGSLVNHAILEQDPMVAPGDSSVYQLEIRDQSAVKDIFLPDNPLGQTRVGSKALVTNFQPAGGGAGVNLLAPSSGNYLGTENAANGFIVLGSNVAFPNNGPVYDATDSAKNEIPKPYTSINNIANIKKDELKYTIPIEKPAGTPDPAYNKANFTNTLQNNNKPSIVLRRLANPYLAPQTDPTQPNYNPYVTVDVMNDIKINDGVTNATDDKKAAPPTIENRSSVVRQQPYQESAKKNVGGIFDVSTNMAKSLVKQPQHTFLRHNGTLSDVPPVGGINAADGLLNLPFTWLVHLDRVPISMPELMNVAGVAPKGVTTAFNNPAFTDGANPIGHKAPWLDGGSRLARFLEFAQVKSRQAGVAQDGRLPGLVNINAIWDVEVFRSLADAKNLYDPKNSNNFIESEIDAVYGAMLGNRSPNSIPSQNDKPFWSLGVGQSVGGDDWSANPRGLNNTILRNNGTLFDLPAVNTAGQNRDAYQKKELLTKIFNSITTKSNTFGVWLTAGYFEVTDDTVKPAKLGAEIGKADGTNIRHRMFAIVDRTNMVNAKKLDLSFVFASNANGLVQDINGNPLAPVNLGNPTLINPANGANINLVNGMTVTIDANTDYEETVSVVLDANGDFWFTPQKLHYPVFKPAIGINPAYYENTIRTIINRGNPGPWIGYDRTKDREVVPYAEIIE